VRAYSMVSAAAHLVRAPRAGQPKQGPGVSGGMRQHPACLEAHHEPQRAPRNPRPTCPAWRLVTSPCTTSRSARHEPRVRRGRATTNPNTMRRASDAANLDRHYGPHAHPRGPRRRALRPACLDACHEPRRRELSVDEALVSRHRRVSARPVGARRPCPFARRLARGIRALPRVRSRVASVPFRLLFGARHRRCEFMRRQACGVGANSPARLVSWKGARLVPWAALTAAPACAPVPRRDTRRISGVALGAFPALLPAIYRRHVRDLPAIYRR